MSPAGTARHPSCSSWLRWTRPAKRTQPRWEACRTAEQARTSPQGCSWEATEAMACLRARWCSWWQLCRLVAAAVSEVALRGGMHAKEPLSLDAMRV